MCGIAGVLYVDATCPADEDVLRRMGGRLAHRGPDAEGFHREPGVGLVHRRLSIIDLAGGEQPMANEDGAIVVVFNGEIYNYQELRTLLLSRGHTLRTHSDTEVLVHLYEDEGDDLVQRLRGMFAFALWDRPRRRLLLARDRVGIKPLYFFRDAEKLVFASELKALFEHPDLPRALDPAALEDYLAYGMVPGSRCIFAGVEKLPAGHVLSVSANEWQSRPRRYWSLRLEPDETRSGEQWLEEVRAGVTEAVRMHLVADVPVGAFLSGGVDSSVVVSLAAGASNGPLRTFSMGFADEAFSELPHARQVAEAFGTQHVEEIVTPDAVELLDQLSHYFDEPFGDSSAVPTFLVSRLAARHVKVVLSGDGGDEAFGGYARYAHDLREAAVRRRLPRWLRRGLLAPLASVWPRTASLPRPLRLRSALTNLSLEEAAAYANTLSITRPPLRRQLLSADVRAGLNSHDPGQLICEAYGHAPPGDALAGMIAADTACLLPDDFLVKVDRASMACGLEVRPPLLDHKLLELAARIPSRWKVCRGTTKWVFKEAFRDRLPTKLMDRPKHGFEMPVDAWLRGPLRQRFEDSVLAPGTRLDGLIDRSTAGELYREHRRGGRHGNTLWALLVLAAWAERYLPGQPAICEGR